MPARLIEFPFGDSDSEALAIGEETEMPTSGEASGDDRTFAQRLRDETVGCRVTTTRFGMSRALSRDKVSMAAAVFSADAAAMSASKRLVNTRDKRIRKVTSIIAQAKRYFFNATIDYPIDGIRLINARCVDRFNATMQDFKSQLQEACGELQEAWDEIRAISRERLGSLYCEAGYPEDIAGQFSLEWGFPSVDPDMRLKMINPQLYEAERQRVVERFEQAMRDAEEAIIAELAALLDHIIDKLQPGEDGKRKTFYESNVTNLIEFFSRFKDLPLKSKRAGEIDAILSQAEQIVSGVDVKEIKQNGDFRARLSERLGEVKGQLDSMITTRSMRSIDFDMD